jgi:hypothetical protein
LSEILDGKRLYTDKRLYRSRVGDYSGQTYLEHGSMLLMDRTTQARWEHAVPRAREAGLRISLTFRRFR